MSETLESTDESEETGLQDDTITELHDASTQVHRPLSVQPTAHYYRDVQTWKYLYTKYLALSETEQDEEALFITWDATARAQSSSSLYKSSNISYVSQ